MVWVGLKDKRQIYSAYVPIQVEYLESTKIKVENKAYWLLSLF